MKLQKVFSEAYVEYYGSAVWIYSVKIVDRNEHCFDFAARTSRFRCVMPEGKRKNRSADVSNISNNSSLGNVSALNISEKVRVNCTSNKQSTLLGFVDSAAMVTTQWQGIRRLRRVVTRIIVWTAVHSKNSYRKWNHC